MELAHKRALIVGGTGGIGSAVALALVQKGVDVAVCSRRPSNSVEGLVESAAQHGRRFFCCTADVTKTADVSRMVDAAVSALDGLDIVVHSAGSATSGDISQLDEAQWLNAFDIHLHSAFHLAKKVAPILSRAADGALVFVSSAAARRAPANAIAYSTAKAALFQFTRCLANGLAGQNVRVNCVAPGFIDTQFHQHMSEEARQELVHCRVPLGRMGEAREVADLICAVIGNSYMTGEIVGIDGGINLSFR